MARIERMRELVSGPLAPEYLQRKASAGWQPVAIEWKREVEAASEGAGGYQQEVPYGLRVGDDCHHLEEDPGEQKVLLLIMELICQDKRLSQVADELNRQNYRTRLGTYWSPGAVFELLPRLIETGPRIFASDEWVARRQHLYNVV